MPSADEPLGSDGAAYRGILKSSALIAGAALVQVLAGIGRVKVLAVVLGPPGLGVMGLVAAAMSTIAQVVGLGLGQSGVREIAAGTADAASLWRTRAALSWCSLALGVLGALGVWLGRDFVATVLLKGQLATGQVGWLSVGVFFSVVAAGQAAQLQGLREIPRLSLSMAGSAVLGSMVAIPVVLVWGMGAVAAFVALPFAVGFVINALLLWRLRPHRSKAARLGEMAKAIAPMVALGSVLMLTQVAAMLGFLLARLIVADHLGIVQLGLFQAAWAVSAQYIGFIFAALAADYYPRLTSAVGSHAAVGSEVNRQLDVALSLAGPVVVLLMGAAPWVLQFLYAPEFVPAAETLQWHVLGDIFKIGSWCVGFVLVAKGARLLFGLTQLLWTSLYVGLIAWGTARFGLVTTGVAFASCYAVGFGIDVLITRRLCGLSLSPSNLKVLAMTGLGAAGVLAVSRLAGSWPALLSSLALSVLLALRGATCMAREAGISGGWPATARWVGDKVSNALRRR